MGDACGNIIPHELSLMVCQGEQENHGYSCPAATQGWFKEERHETLCNAWGYLLHIYYYI